MKKYLMIAGIALGTLVLVVAIFMGGWIFLDNFVTAPYAEAGTRELFQQSSTNAAMEQPLVYAGTATCMQCHYPSGEEWQHSSHSLVGCEDCHGPGNAHVTSGAPMLKEVSASLCLTCHAQLDARPESFPQVLAGEHSGGIECTACHDPMHPNIGGAPHMPDISPENTDCVTCHKPGKLVSMPADHELRSDDSCTQCHTVGGEK